MSILKRATQGRNAGKAAGVNAYTGVVVTVSAVGGPYLFTARLESAAGGRAQLSYLHSPEDANLVAWTSAPFEAELRGYSSSKIRAIRGRGRVQHGLGGIWYVSNVTFEDKSDERSDIRYEADFDASVTFPNRRGLMVSCRVADMSMGGVCLMITHPTAEGEHLLLTASLLAAEGIEVLPCLVCYNRFRDDGKLLCGCKFQELSGDCRARLDRLLVKLEAMHPPSRKPSGKPPLK